MASHETTWRPYDGPRQPASGLPESVFAFPRERKEPLFDAAHVRNALARFDQVADVSEAERAAAFENIRAAAAHYGVHVSETSWRDLMR